MLIYAEIEQKDRWLLIKWRKNVPKLYYFIRY